FLAPPPLPPTPPLVPYTTLFRSVVVVTLAAPLQHDWAPVVTVDFSTSTLTRHDADGSSTNLDRVSTLAFTVGVRRRLPAGFTVRSEEHTSELQSRFDLVCRLLLV